MVYVRCAAFFGTLSREFLMMIPMGRSEDIWLALRRREQREMKDKKSNVPNFLEAQWVRGKALPRDNRGTPWKKAPNDCDHPPNAIQKGGQRCDVLRTMRALRESVGGRIPLTMVARDPETKLNCVYREATGRNRTPLLPARTREHDDAGHAATEPLLGMLDVQYNLRTQPGRVRCSTCRPGEFRRCRREHGSHLGRRDTMPLNVQGQLKDVDQEVYLQLVYESGQRPENQMTTLGLVPRQKVESGRTGDRAF